MNKILLAVSVLLTYATSANAQTLSDLLKSSTVQNVVTAVTGGTSVTTSNVSGTWHYSGSAVELTGGSTIEQAAMAVAGAEAESKINTALETAGLDADSFLFTFDTSSNFTCVAGSKTLSGTYTLDSTEGTMTFKFSNLDKLNLGSLTANVTLTSSTMCLMFQADKLLDLVDKVATIANNDSLNSINTLLKNYDGLLLGAELTK